MMSAIQQAVQVFASLALASTMSLSLAIGVAGAFHQRFPLQCAACHSPASADVAAAHDKLILAGLH